MKRLNMLNKQGVIMAIVAIITLVQMPVKAQEIDNEYESRLSGTLSYKLIKDLKLNFTPELRFDKDFAIDKALLETELVYSPLKYVAFSSAYRFIANPRKTKDTEYLHKLALAAKLEKSFDRFTPAFKLTYSNYADDDIDDKEFLRYKLSTDYDLKNSKITPSIGLEAYQDISDFSLYKLRYTTGLDYKLIKNNYIGVSYKFDYYMNEYKNKHIFSVGYKLKF